MSRETPRTSYRAIDCGFDLRLHPEMRIDLSLLDWPQIIEVDHEGEACGRLCAGLEDAKAWLRTRGYRV